jgi:hypothetical protein
VPVVPAAEAAAPAAAGPQPAPSSVGTPQVPPHLEQEAGAHQGLTLADAVPSSAPAPPQHPPLLHSPGASAPQVFSIAELQNLLASVTATAAPAHSASSVSDATTGALILSPPSAPSRAGSFPRYCPASHGAGDNTPLAGALSAAGM